MYPSATRIHIGVVFSRSAAPSKGVAGLEFNSLSSFQQYFCAFQGTRRQKSEIRNQKDGEARTAASTNHHRHERKAIASRFPGGLRSVVAVKRFWHRSTSGCEGPQPSRPPPTIIAMNASPLLAGVGGRPLRRRRVGRSKLNRKRGSPGGSPYHTIHAPREPSPGRAKTSARLRRAQSSRSC